MDFNSGYAFGGLMYAFAYGGAELRLFVSIVDSLNRLCIWVVGLLLFVMSVSVLAQVLVRFVLTAGGLNISAPWTEELARYCLIWMVFLGAGVGVRHAQMIALEFLVTSLPKVLGQIVRYCVIVLSIAFFAMMVWVGLEFVELGKTETSPVMNLTKTYVYWAMPVGATLMIINSLALVAATILEGGDIRFPGNAEIME